MRAPRYVCIHGHFYQPPRENPWLELVERQESAWPAHDWNERVTDECYASNAHARILDATGRIEKIVSNYASLSFNFGPTLLSWLEDTRPELHAALIESDKHSAERFGGHGSAVAQVFNHMIMPLASPRDQRTQVVWGLRDFERRFGRASEGMWLAETAVDLASLEALAEQGVKYTILAPHQCARIRPPGGEWRDAVDPRRPYLLHLPSGRRLSVFFYDGPISQAVAFERLLDDGYRFAERLLKNFDDRAEPQLVHIATDGETYGHHHSYGEMALAVAFARIESEPGVELINYGQFLERHPPTWEAQIKQRTSWSCMHGVERWRADCGCNTGTGWHQRWRAPLREALDWLRDELAPRYERDAGSLLRDPWAARDAYIDVVLDRSSASIDSFFAAHADRELNQDGRQRALELLEMQRHAMLMFTSCGWFFDEPSGLETIQVLRYAARAMQLATGLFGDAFEPGLRERLQTAPSNRPEYRTVDGIYRAFVDPSKLDLSKVGAHFAIGAVLDGPEPFTLPGFDAELIEHEFSGSSRSSLSIGRLRVRSRITTETSDSSYAVLHFGDHNLLGGIRPFAHVARHVATHGALTHAFDRADLTEVVRQIERQFEGGIFSLRSLFHDQQAAILDRLLAEHTRAVEETLESIYDETAPLMRFLQSVGQSAPPVFRASAEYTMRLRLRRALGAGEAIDLSRVARILGEAKESQIVLDPVELGMALESTLETLIAAAHARPDDLELTNRLANVASFVAESPWKMDLGEAENGLWRLMRTTVPRWRRDSDQARIDALTRVATHLRMRVPGA